ITWPRIQLDVQGANQNRRAIVLSNYWLAYVQSSHGLDYRSLPRHGGREKKSERRPQAGCFGVDKEQTIEHRMPAKSGRRNSFLRPAIPQQRRLYEGVSSLVRCSNNFVVFNRLATRHCSA